MKKWLILAALVGLAVFLIAAGSPAQEAKPETRMIVGPDGGELFGNGYMGVLAGIEQPLGKRFEVDGYVRLDPWESHVALGHGWAETGRASGIWWFTKSVGLDGSFEQSAYHVSISKTGYYALGGITLRGTMLDAPARFTFDYAREVRNGIDKTGTETPHLQGGVFSYDARLGCRGLACFRLRQELWIAGVLTQGNPVCDGTFGQHGSLPPCPRQATLSGGTDTSFVVEFPRRKRGTESELW